jgi:predicted flap endonuclease-1-like 5' DNA nuclease
MDAISPQITMYLLGCAVAGLLLGWLLRGLQGKRYIERLRDEWQIKLDNFVRQRDHLTSEASTLRSTIESQQGAISRNERLVTRAQTELESAREKERLLTKNLFTLRSEREKFKSKMVEFQDKLAFVQQQSSDLQIEFIKSRDFYKGELSKAFEKRKALEIKFDNAKAEHESFANLLQSSRSEHDSVNKMLASAQKRLANLDALEQDVIRLEAENAQLKHDATDTRLEIESLRRDIEEIDELKVQNKELAHCLKSMENSRKQYEQDAMRYRDQAGQQEQQSETLRMKLDEVEQNFAEMERQQRQALSDARKSAARSALNGKKAATEEADERDDLQEIVGVGKVFEQALHELGIFKFSQIAAFDISDIARVNSKLKDFKGRMEQDDWIGQAKELHFKKYG